MNPGGEGGFPLPPSPSLLAVRRVESRSAAERAAEHRLHALERACPLRSSQRSGDSDTHKTPYDIVKRCRKRKINTKASECVNWLDYSPPNRADRFDSRRGRYPNFRSWESCRTMPLVGGGFLGDLPFPPPLCSGAAPYPPRFILIGLQDHDVRSRPNLSNPLSSAGMQRGKLGNPRGIQPTCENPGATTLGIEAGPPRWEASSLTTTPPRPPCLRERDKVKDSPECREVAAGELESRARAIMRRVCNVRVFRDVVISAATRTGYAQDENSLEFNIFISLPPRLAFVRLGGGGGGRGEGSAAKVESCSRCCKMLGPPRQLSPTRCRLSFISHRRLLSSSPASVARAYSCPRVPRHDLLSIAALRSEGALRTTLTRPEEGLGKESMAMAFVRDPSQHSPGMTGNRTRVLPNASPVRHLARGHETEYHRTKYHVPIGYTDLRTRKGWALTIFSCVIPYVSVYACAPLEIEDGVFPSSATVTRIRFRAIAERALELDLYTERKLALPKRALAVGEFGCCASLQCSHFHSGCVHVGAMPQFYGAWCENLIFTPTSTKANWAQSAAGSLPDFLRVGIVADDAADRRPSVLGVRTVVVILIAIGNTAAMRHVANGTRLNTRTYWNFTADSEAAPRTSSRRSRANGEGGNTCKHLVSMRPHATLCLESQA
ncbi:hypothetical protein PR048_020554 [Dryococelus australis]|uniref:Uncharacterized protein n=1 Tax=Dryococelus australis TaxID=614101 RepID=A0ABQ9H6K8_9NEOP|nr:hypothetical protein PR048_020554 [Dryococelus australis]